MNIVKQAIYFNRLRRDWLGGEGRPSPHAQARANTCLQCPKRDVDSSMEEGAKRLIVRTTLSVKQKLEWHVKGEDELHLCGMCGCLLETKVFVPLELARENTPDWKQFPSTCWLRAEAPE